MAESQSGLLAILDNVDSDDAKSAVKAKLTELNEGHVLITSRLAGWGAGVQKLELDVLSLDTAKDYLLEAADARRTTADDDATACEVAIKVGQLALGLEHAKAYINAYGISYADYLQEWEQDEAEILSEFDLGEIDYPRSLLVTWKLSVDRLDADARTLLDVLSWFAADPIPESVLEQLPEGLLKSNPRKALAKLVNFSLVSRDFANEAAAFQLHRLVQATTRFHQQSLESDSQADDLPQLEIALQTINGSFVGDPTDVRNWPVLEPLVEHAQAIADFGIKHAKTSTTHPPPAF